MTLNKQSFSKKNLLLTGATGFIGKALFNRLINSEEKFNIFVISRRPEKDNYFTDRGAEYIVGDISDYKIFEKMDKTFDVIIHAAGCVSNSPKNKINPIVTENICRLALESNVERLIYISSVSVVSGNKEVPLSEDLPYLGSTPYAESKIAAEKVVIEYREKGLPVIILRPPIVYGKGEPHYLPILSKFLKFRALPLPEGGRVRFHMVYIENLVDAIIFSLETDKMFSGTYFVADSQALQAGQVFSIMAEGMGVKPPIYLNDFYSKLFSWIPLVRKLIKFFKKDRVYSTEKIESLGFCCSVNASDALLLCTERKCDEK